MHFKGGGAFEWEASEFTAKEINTHFTLAIEVVKIAQTMTEYRAKFTIEILNVFYGWYMVVTEGCCAEIMPASITEEAEILRWEAWRRCSQESYDVMYAKEQYIYLL